LISKRGIYYDLVEAQKNKKKESSVNQRESTVATNANVNGFDSSTYFPKDNLIDFHRVEFKYPSRQDQPIFRGLNMSVKDGETIAIVGPR
jgi:ABC-type multidrug transport system fused ATPase/permease subunit